MKTAIRMALAMAAVTIVVFASTRCGGDKGDSGDDQGGSDPNPPGPVIPEAWDGTNDWSESAWSIIDED